MSILETPLENIPVETKAPVFIQIANDGEIEHAAMTLIGASTKRDDGTKIGFFGSGLKNAIAVLIRNKIPLRIYSGEKEVKITTKSIDFRGKTFEQIFINGKATSLTTDMGIDWEPWFALREVLCNAMDEGGHVIEVADAATPLAGKTTIYIEMTDKMDDVFKDWNKYFCEKRADVLHNVLRNRVFHGDEKEFIVYRKGIRCHYEKTPCLYHYDFDWVEINESRVIKNEWEFRMSLVKWLASNADEDMVRNIFDNGKRHLEWQLDWHWSLVEFNDNWLNVIGGRSIVPEDVAGYFIEDVRDGALVLPSSLCRQLKEHFKEKVHVAGVSDGRGEKYMLTMTPRQIAIIQECKDFLAKAEINVAAEIKVCKFRKDYIQGEADKDNDIIYLSPDVFNLGKRAVLLVIVEEMAHLKSGAPDNSRSFQDYLINQFVCSIEERTGQYL